jgi:hypothetical protein
MSAFVVILLVISAIVLIVIVAIGSAARERERVAGVVSWAGQNGFAFHKDDPFDLDRRYNGMGDVGRGHSRYAYEILHRSDPAAVFIFRYYFQTTETRTVTHTNADGSSHTTTETYEESHHRAYFVIELNAAFPALHIRPEHWGDKLAGLIGFDDINFESEQFSRRYFCKSDNREFAYAVIHPQMIEWMMDLKFVGQLEDGKFIIDISGLQYDAGGIGQTWEQAVGFINRIPPFVWQDYGKRAKLELPPPIRYQPADAGNPNIESRNPN